MRFRAYEALNVWDVGLGFRIHVGCTEVSVRRGITRWVPLLKADTVLGLRAHVSYSLVQTPSIPLYKPCKAPLSNPPYKTLSGVSDYSSHMASMSRPGNLQGLCKAHVAATTHLDMLEAELPSPTNETPHRLPANIPKISRLY